MAEERRPNPTEQVTALFEESESRTAHAFAELVARDSFGELHWGIRETLRASDQEEVSLLGWCIGGTLCLLYGGFYEENAVRNMAPDIAQWLGERSETTRRGDRDANSANT